MVYPIRGAKHIPNSITEYKESRIIIRDIFNQSPSTAIETSILVKN